MHVEQLVAGFSRYHKYPLGAELRAGSRGVLQQVLKANNAPGAAERKVELLVLRERIDAPTSTLRTPVMLALVGRVLVSTRRRAR